MAPNLVASLLKQLVKGCTVTSDNLESLYQYHIHQNTHTTLDKIMNILQLEIRKYSKVFIVIDTLDECSEWDGTQTKLLTVLQSLLSTVSLLVTSCDISSIAPKFKGCKLLYICVSDQDVWRYVEGWISHEPWLAKHVDGHPNLQETIVNHIVGGM
jgi:hypothetical protein